MTVVPEYSQQSPSPTSIHDPGTNDATTLPPVVGAARRFSFRRKTPSDPITIFPQPRRFAVVQMDPVAMLTTAALDDPEALAAANALVTKKYLVYLETGLDLPMPQSKWCTYGVNPIASTLRAECPEWGITPDMVLPIPPNTAHLKVPNPFLDPKDPDYVFEFPFKNCFFWADSDTELRVRVRRDGDEFDNSKAVSLPLRPHLRVMNGFTPDIATIGEFLSRPRDKPARHPPAATIDGTPSRPPDPHFDALKGHLPTLLDADSVLGGGSDGNSNDTGSPSSTSGLDTALVPSPFEDLLSMNIFGWLPDPATKYVPLVNCWFELEEHLDENTIPSPVKLWTEQQRIGAIINAAIERRNEATRRAVANLKSRPVLAPLETATALTIRLPEKRGPWRILSGIVTAGLSTLAKVLQGEYTDGGRASQPASPPRRTKVASPTASRSQYRRTQKPN